MGRICSVTGVDRARTTDAAFRIDGLYRENDSLALPDKRLGLGHHPALGHMARAKGMAQPASDSGLTLHAEGVLWIRPLAAGSRLRRVATIAISLQ